MAMMWCCLPIEARTRNARLHTLRQQMDKGEGKLNSALADFVAPQGDYVGGSR